MIFAYNRAVKFLWLLPLAVILGACQTPADSTHTEMTDTSPAVAGEPEASGSGSGVQIHTGGAGGVAPVTGNESLGGGGSGVGSAAKSAAKRAAGNAGQGSMGRMESGDE